MRILSFVAAGAVPASLAHCPSALAQGPDGPGPRLRVMGLVSEPSIGLYSFANLDNFAMGSDSVPVHAKLPLVTPAGHPVPFEVWEEAVRVEVLQRNPEHTKYNVLLGPKLCVGTPNPGYLCSTNGAKGAGWIERYEEAGKKASGTMVFHLQQGWAIMWSNPTKTTGKTDWVVGGTEGSTMIIEIVDETKQRVYFVAGAKIDVDCRLSPGSPSGPPPIAGKYVEVTRSGDSCNFSNWTPIPSVTPLPTDPVEKEIAVFVDQAKKMAEAAGKPKP